jgi:glycosyltransferase involved in cell wall biosynthesis
VVTHSLELGGGQLYLDQLLRGLLPNPKVFCLLVAPRDGPLRRTAEECGIAVLITGPYAHDDLLAYENQVLELAAVAQCHEIDIALINTMSAALGADACSRLGLPYLWAIHESVPPELFWVEAYGVAGCHPEIRRRGIRALGDAGGLIFEADATLDLYSNATIPDRLLKVPYGIDMEPIDRYRDRSDRRELRRAEGIADDDIALVSIGTMEPRKSQAGLVLAFAQITQKHPRARLILVGDMPGAYSAAVHKLVDQLGLSQQIVIEPIDPDVYSWYSIADIVVNASDLESMPRSLLEAMAFERVVLSTDVFGVSELIEDGNTGFLMAPRDLAALIDGFDRVLALSASERSLIGAAASRAVRASHNSSGYIAAYRDLLAI